MSRVLPIQVDNEFAYNIIITDNFDELLENIIKIKPDTSVKLCIVGDSNTNLRYGETVQKQLCEYYTNVLTYTFPAGEENKTTETVGQLYEYLINEHFTRQDCLLALGGGVVGDLTGFTAATYLRGIDFIQIPTSLLSQVDSSIGGKTGVDYLRYKNMVGAFYMPRLVYIHTGVLSSLPDDQFASGMGEVIKYGLIQRADFYDWLGEHVNGIKAKEPALLEEMIGTSCACKKEVVEEDPTEQGIRAILNFGHTIGHAIEKLSDYRLFHGQCVAIGMVAASALSVRRGYIADEEQERLIEMLRAFDLPTETSGLSVDAILSATRSDKKMVGDRLKFILLEAVGKARIVDDVGDDELRACVQRVLA